MTKARTLADFIGSDSDVKFDTDTLYVDSSTDRVGIGTSSPSVALEVNGGTDNEPIKVVSTDTGSYISVADNGTTGSTRFGAVSNDFKIDVNSSERMRIDSSGNVGIGTSSPNQLLEVSGSGAKSRFTRGGSAGTVVEYYFGGTHAGGVQVQSTGLGIGGGARENDLFINTSGHVLINTTDDQPPTNNDAHGIALRTDGKVAASRSNGISGDFNTGANGDLIWFRKGGTVAGKIGVNNTSIIVSAPNNGGSGLMFNDNAAPIYPTKVVSGVATIGDAYTDLGAGVHRFKNLYLSGGVYLGGTGASNQLEDYEEGEFSYSIVGSSSGGWTNRTGYTKGTYTKVGKVVTIQLRFETTSRNSPSGSYVQITGFPFTCIASTGTANGQVQTAINFRGNGQSSDSCGTYGLINNNTAVMSIFIRRSNSAYSFDAVTPNDVSSNCEGGIQFTYITA